MKVGGQLSKTDQRHQDHQDEDRPLFPKDSSIVGALQVMMRILLIGRANSIQIITAFALSRSQVPPIGFARQRFMFEDRDIPITCYIRTFNESERIGPVVARALETGAEVLVVDSLSTDGTQEIARKAGARVIEHTWDGGGKQKRVAEDAAKHDWLLDIDADELLSSDLRDEIYETFKDGEPEPGLYYMNYVTVPPVPKGRVWWKSNPVRRCKFYHKSVARIPDHEAWDQFEIPKGVRPQQFKGPIMHHSFLSITHLAGKMNRVSEVRAYKTPLKTRWVLALRVLFAFPIYFLKKFIKRQMWRQGIYGVIFSAVSASNRWMKDAKMYERILAESGKNKIGE